MPQQRSLHSQQVLELTLSGKHMKNTEDTSGESLVRSTCLQEAVRPAAETGPARRTSDLPLRKQTLMPLTSGGS